MPHFKSETAFGSGDLRWLGSRHALNNAQTAMVDVSAFTKATHYPDGYLPSGTAVAKITVDGADRLVPYTVAEGTTTGAGVLAGHILFDQAVKDDTDFAVPLFDHGRVNEEFVPGDFTAPVAPAKLARTSIVYK